MGQPTLFSDMPGSTDPFDAGQPGSNANPLSPYDLQTPMDQAFGYALQGATDLNPFPMMMRGLRGFNEDWSSKFDGTRVSAEDARKEVESRGLDLKIPDNGISRWELDNIQYFKQREMNRNGMLMGSRGVSGGLAQFAGGLAGGVVDPLNIASMFLPIVPEARVAAALARAGESTFARAAVRVGYGAVEGAVGAAAIEPVSLIGAQQQQAEYGITDSFMNVMFGGILGGGLHAVGGAVYDYRGSKAARSIGDFAARLERDAAARAPDEVHLEALATSTLATELDRPVRASEVFRDYEQRTRSESAKQKFTIDKANNGPGEVTWDDLAPTTSHADIGALTARADYFVNRFHIEQDGYVYHATNVERAQEIADSGGLQPHNPGDFTDQAAWPDGSEAQRIYFSENPKTVAAFAPEDGQSLILRTVKPEDAKRESGTGDIVAEKPVPADKLEVLGADGSWHPIRDVFKAADEYSKSVAAKDGARASEADQPPGRMDPNDSWAQDAERDGAAFDPEAAKLDIPDEQRIAEEADAFKAHVESLRQRGLVTPEMEDMIKAADEEAAMLEEEAAAWDAAVICETEA